jgi:hypothetical protein
VDHISGDKRDFNSRFYLATTFLFFNLMTAIS